MASGDLDVAFEPIESSAFVDRLTRTPMRTTLKMLLSGP